MIGALQKLFGDLVYETEVALDFPISAGIVRRDKTVVDLRYSQEFPDHLSDKFPAVVGLDD